MKGMELQFREQGGDWRAHPGSADEGKQVIKGLQPATPYEFRLRFENNIEKGKWGRSVSITTASAEQQLATALARIAGLEAQNEELRASLSSDQYDLAAE